MSDDNASTFSRRLEQARRGDAHANGRLVLPDPYAPFPVEALPRPLGAFVREGADALGCDTAYLALPCLAVCAGAIGNSRALRLKRTWTEPVGVWSVIVGESGTLKTPAWALAIAPLRTAQRKLVDEHKRELKQWRDQDQNGERPTLSRVLCSDVTVESLAMILEDNPRGLLVSRDEMSGWLGSFKRYKSQGASSDLPNWLEMYQAGTVNVDRKTGDRKHVFVERALVSVTGGIQPRTLARCLTEEHFEAGLAARLLMAWPDRVPKAWTEAEISEATQERYGLLVDRLLGLSMRSLPDGGKAPNRLLLSAEAKRLWVRFYDEWAQEQAAAEGELAACLSKLEGYAARLALLHHVVTMLDLDASDERDVGAASVEAGIALTRWFAAEARRIYSTLTEGDAMRDTRRLVTWIRSRKGCVTARELQRSNSRRYASSEDAENTLDGLVQNGFGRWEDGPPPPAGGHRIRAFVLAPTHDTSDTRPPEVFDQDEGPPNGCADTPFHDA
jgi:hypothetical protein